MIMTGFNCMSLAFLGALQNKSTFVATCPVTCTAAFLKVASKQLSIRFYLKYLGLQLGRRQRDFLKKYNTSNYLPQ